MEQSKDAELRTGSISVVVGQVPKVEGSRPTNQHVEVSWNRGTPESSILMGYQPFLDTAIYVSHVKKNEPHIFLASADNVDDVGKSCCLIGPHPGGSGPRLNLMFFFMEWDTPSLTPWTGLRSFGAPQHGWWDKAVSSLHWGQKGIQTCLWTLLTEGVLGWFRFTSHIQA